MATTSANEIVIQSQANVSHDVEALVQAAVSVLTNDMQIATHEVNLATTQHDQNTVQLLVDTCATNNIQDRLYMCTDCNLAFYGEQGEQEWQWHLKQHKPYKCDLCSEAFEGKDSLKVHMRCHTMQMPFICEKCGSAYSLKANLVQHMKSHEDKLYQCGDCNVMFKSQTNLEKHLKFHTGETIKVYQCEQCAKTFNQQKNLVQHMKIHMGGEKAFKCSECPATYSYKCHLTRHLMIHSGDKPYKCKFCGKAFNRNAHLIRHRKIHSGSEKEFKCNQCGFAFWEKSDLIRHTKSHEGNRPFTCEFCEQTFVWRRYLYKHLTNNHRDENKHFCCDCCKAFDTEEELYDHSNTEHGNKKQLTHTCEVCKAEFHFKYKLDEHMFIHTGRKAHACDKCTMKFVSRKELDRHIAEHSQEVSFACNTCQKTFSSIDQLQKHVKLHTGSGKYPCTICGSSFRWKSQLNSHMVVHSQDFDFLCSICNKSFKRKRDLTRHVKIYHNTKPPYTCVECNTDHHTPYNLHKHNTDMHWRKIDSDLYAEYACTTCTGVFRIKSDLDRHLAKVHPPRPFHCSICQKRFTMMKFLEKHFELKHEGIEMIEGENYVTVIEVINENVEDSSEKTIVENDGNEFSAIKVDYEVTNENVGDNNLEIVAESDFNSVAHQFGEMSKDELSDVQVSQSTQHMLPGIMMDTSDLQVDGDVSQIQIKQQSPHHHQQQQQPISEAITLAHFAQQASSQNVLPIYLHEVIGQQATQDGGNPQSMEIEMSQNQQAQAKPQQQIQVVTLDQLKSGNMISHSQLQMLKQAAAQGTISIAPQGQNVVTSQQQSHLIQSSNSQDVKSVQQMIQTQVVSIPQPQVIRIQSRPTAGVPLSLSTNNVTFTPSVSQNTTWPKVIKVQPEQPQNSGAILLQGQGDFKTENDNPTVPVLQSILHQGQGNIQNVVEISGDSVVSQLPQIVSVMSYGDSMDVNSQIVAGLVEGTDVGTN